MTSPSSARNAPAGPSPVRDMFASILRRMVVLLVALGIGGGVVGYLAAGSEGLWGALLGTGVVAFFMTTTAGVMLLTADRPMHVASAAFMGSWILKVVVVFGALVLLRDATFYSPLAFFIVLSLAIIGSVGIEMAGALAARVPYVQPGPRPPEQGGAQPPAGDDGTRPDGER